ncbi:TatD family hydrolase [Thermophilibacter sp.]
MDVTRWDTHCHLGWFADPARVAAEAAGRGLGALAVTVTPSEYAGAAGALAGAPNVRLAAGLHPWWVRSADDADALVALLPGLRWVGEVGLDASPRRVGTWDAQVAAFERVCAACARTSDAAAPKVLSVHAVRAAGAALDALEATGAAARCRCVLHWFSGSSEELWRAVRLGCSFSFGERALATRRGREYARVLPADRLLAETDLPAAPDAPGGADELAASLERAEAGIAAARGMGADEVRALLAQNAEELLR